MLLEFKGVNFSYDKNTHVIKNLNFSLNDDEIVVIEGKSGSGKSTFLHLAGLLVSPTSGMITFLGKDVFWNNNIYLLRRQIGYVFQSHLLWKDLSVVENVLIPMTLQGISFHNAREQAINWLHAVELDEYINTPVVNLSGGQQQRVGLARAFAHNPRLILADEPTGNLDEDTGDKIMNLCISIARKNKISMVYVTHNTKWNNMFDKQYYFQHGKLNLVRENYK
ncbi:MAG: ABC transporter ATP-binding protein [Alphaproteobacteria bacterium]|nr:MAG: ABC transporter ATP-binding protein [Alphaproteobacteria bacterium]